MLASSSRAFLGGQQRLGAHSSGTAAAQRPVARVHTSSVVIEAAHKKGAGSTKNGRDSESKRRGIKVFGGQPVRAGGIIYRQTGSTWHAGDNVGTGGDYTLFSKVDGVVIYSKKPGRDVVHVYPMEHEKAQAALKATHTTAAPSGTSRKERRRAQYSPRGAARAAAAATVAAVAAAVTP